MKLFAFFFLLLIPVVSASISTITTNQNLYPGESFQILIINPDPPTLIDISVNNPCLVQKSLLMTTTSQNLTVKINSSTPIGVFTCSFIFSYNGTIQIINPPASPSGGSSSSDSQTTTSTVQRITNQTGFPWWYYQNYNEYKETTSIISNGTTSTIESTTTSILSWQEKIKFDKFGRFYIAGIVLLVALISIIVYLEKNKPVDPFKKKPPIYEPKV